MAQIGGSSFAESLLLWWGGHERDFPWRLENDPYLVLIAELMLRRTHARQVVPVYLAFRTCYPSLEGFARASDSELRTILKPLGLHWRIANFVDLAGHIKSRGWRILPCVREELINLPGVGEYVADAVLCFACGEPAVLIDTNICRVVCRIEGLPIYGESRRNKRVRAAIQELADDARCREYHYALIDFAEQVCRPKRPQCHVCPFSSYCHYYQSLFADAGNRVSRMSDGEE